MAHWRSCSLGFEIRRFQVEIPARLAVSIIYQHHAVAVPQSQRLFLDYFHVLANKTRSEYMNDEGHDRKPRKNIPRCAEIEPAEILADGRYGGATRQPVSPGTNHFEALIRQDEIDRCGGGFAGNKF